ncbi:Methionyl-tRNA formyltransferase, partial [Coemansia helicoidea]
MSVLLRGCGARVLPQAQCLRRGVSSTAAVHGLKVLFFGTDEFAARALAGLETSRFAKNTAIDHIEVVCPPSVFKKKGLREKLYWRAQAAVAASALGLKVHNPPDRDMSTWKVPTVCEAHGGGNFDIGVVASFGRILPPSIIDSFNQGMINVHPSLLPLYRGPSPIQTAILNGDTTTGVTVQELHPRRVDAGRVLAQVPFPIRPSATRLDLMFQLGYLGGEMAGKVLQNLAHVRANSVAQSENNVTTTRLFEMIDTRIDWETMTAVDIFRMHRAHYGHEPVYSHLRIKNKHVMINLLDLKLAVPSQKPLADDYLDLSPGTLTKKKLVPYIEIPCIGGGRIHVYRFGPAGKAHLDSGQFNAGYIKKSKDARL